MPIISTTNSDKEVELSDKLKSTQDTIETVESKLTAIENTVADNRETLTARIGSQSRLFQMLLSQHQGLDAKVETINKEQKKYKESARKEQVMSIAGILAGCGFFYFNETLGLMTMVMTTVLVNLFKLPNKL